MRFDQAYVFKYSRRRDTPAAEMPDQIPEEVIEERHRRLLGAIDELALLKYDALVGQRVEILVEGPSHRNRLRYEGRTRSNKIVVFDGTERHRGQLMQLRIERARNFTLYGDPAIVGFEPELVTEPTPI